MLCPRCGSDLPEGSKVCRFCKDIPVDSVTFSEPLSSTPALTPKLTPEVQPASLGVPQKGKGDRPAAWRRVLPAVIVAVLVAGAGVGFSLFKESGGTQEWQATVILEAESTARQQVTPEKLQQCVEVIKERLADLAIADFAVAAGEDDTIVVSLALPADVAEVRSAVLQQGRAGFYDVAEFGTAYASEAEALATAGVASEEALPPGTSLIVWPGEVDWSGSGADDEYYLVTAAPAVTGEMLEEAGWDTQSAEGSYRVTLEFNDEGAAAFAEITGELAEIGAITGELQQLAIVVDGVVQSAPTVQERIEGGSAEITGNFTLEEVKSLALVLQNGALSLELTLRP